MLAGVLGFNVWATCDGNDWFAVTRDAFTGNEYNFGGRNLVTGGSHGQDLFIGSANQAQGTSIFDDRGDACGSLINDGAKAIGIKQVFVATSVNGRLSSSPMVSQSDQVAPKARVLLGALSDVWRDTTSAWAMDVTVTTDRGDVYKNQIVWK